MEAFEKLQETKKLLEQGIITDEEFQEIKTRLLDEMINESPKKEETHVATPEVAPTAQVAPTATPTTRVAPTATPTTTEMVDKQQVLSRDLCDQQTNNTSTSNKGRKKIIIGGAAAGAVLLIIIIALFAGSNGMKEVSFGDYTFEIPKEYTFASSDGDMDIYSVGSTDYDALLAFSRIYNDSFYTGSFEENKLAILEGVAQGMTDDYSMAISDDGTFTGVEVGGENMNGKADAFYDEDDGYIYIIVISQDEDSNKDYLKEVTSITKSAKKTAD